MHKGKYYDKIASGYDELHRDEQLAKIAKIISSIDPSDLPKKDDYLLDVGCGSGISTACWESKSVGIDPSIELIKIAKEKYKTYKNLDFLVGMAENLPFRNDTFDYVISLTAVHNFTDIKKGLNEMKRVGKKGFIFTILRKSGQIDKIEKLIIINFKVKKIVMEDKDLIFICEKLVRR